MRQILAVVFGFILWSAGWLGYTALLREFAWLSADQTQAIRSTGALFALLAGSCILS
jgi:hypothetical protein